MITICSFCVFFIKELVKDLRLCRFKSQIANRDKLMMQLQGRQNEVQAFLAFYPNMEEYYLYPFGKGEQYFFKKYLQRKYEQKVREKIQAENVLNVHEIAIDPEDNEAGKLSSLIKKDYELKGIANEEVVMQERQSAIVSSSKNLEEDKDNANLQQIVNRDNHVVGCEIHNYNMEQVNGKNYNYCDDLEERSNNCRPSLLEHMNFQKAVQITEKPAEVNQLIKLSPDIKAPTRTGLNHQPAFSEYLDNPEEVVLTEGRLLRVSGSQEQDKQGEQRAVQNASEAMSAGTCTICIGDLDSLSNPYLIRIPGCNHEFHSECICKWIERSAQCPLCKNNLRLSLISYLRQQV